MLRSVSVNMKVHFESKSNPVKNFSYKNVYKYIKTYISIYEHI